MGASFMSCAELLECTRKIIVFEKCNAPGVIAGREVRSVCNGFRIRLLRLIPTTFLTQDIALESQAVYRPHRCTKHFICFLGPASGFLDECDRAEGTDRCTGHTARYRIG